MLKQPTQPFTRLQLTIQSLHLLRILRLNPILITHHLHKYVHLLFNSQSLWISILQVLKAVLLTLHLPSPINSTPPTTIPTFLIHLQTHSTEDIHSITNHYSPVESCDGLDRGLID
jgi:hypothetical protein